MLKKFISYYYKHRGLLILDLVAALIVSSIDLVFPLVTKMALNDLIPNGMMKELLIIVGLLFLIYFIRFGCSYIINYWGHVMGGRIERDMREDLFRKFQVLDDRFFDNHKTGKLMSNLTDHLRDISEMSHHAPEDIFISIFMILGSFTILTSINLLLTIIIFIVLAVMILYSFYRRKKMIKNFRRVRSIHGELNSQIESSLGGIRLTKAYNNELFEIKKFQTVNQEYQESWKSTYYQLGLFQSGNEFLVEMCNLTLLLAGGIFVFNQVINVVDLFTFFLYINFLIKPITRIVNSMQQIQQGISGFERFYQIMILEPEIKNVEHPICLEKVEGEIVFQNVSFKYSDENAEVLHNFNLTISKGKKVALVGETGVGKSTISKLIPRFYEATSGKILIDGREVKEYDLSSLRSSIGHVQQDVFIFWGSIYENILYGRPNATFDEVVEAAKSANIHEYILTLEHGYETLVGEKGVKLSGGQKQRISIARLFLKNPSILILDEATSSLDNVTEKLIQDAFDSLAKGKTTIIIAHRLSTIKNVDEILVLGKSGIVERGTHKELLGQNGYYKKLYDATIEI